jgi:uncharacterized protein (UPF0333 family)
MCYRTVVIYKQIAPTFLYLFMKNQRGLVNAAVLLAIIVGLIVVGGGAYFIMQQNSSSQTATGNNTPSLPSKSSTQESDSSNNNTLVANSCAKPSISVSEKPSFGLTTWVEHSIELTLTSNQSEVIYTASNSGIKVFGIKNGLLTGSAPKEAGVYAMTITATNDCGASATRDLSFRVLPYVNIQADLSDDITQTAALTNPGPTVLNGKSVLLSWRFMGSSNCNLTADAPTAWSGKINASIAYENAGEKDSGPLTRSLTYILRCSAVGGIENSDSVKIMVRDAGIPAVDLDARGSKNPFGYNTNSDGPITLTPKASATLSWASQNVSSCTLSSSGSNQISAITGISNSGVDTGPLNGKTTYRVDCQSSSGPVSDLVVIDTQTVGD